MSFSGRLALLDGGDIDGQDPQIVAPVQRADPGRQGFRRVDFGAGMNTLFGQGDQHRLTLEALFPIYQDLDGPQLETDWRVVLGYQFTIY